MSKPREHWSSTFGFLMAAAGSAIGLGTLWKFPYVTGENGGGAFFLVYVLCTLFIGVPVFIAELILGRYAQKGAVGTFSAIAGHATPWKIAGWLGVISSFLIMSFYSVIAGWGLNYAMMSLNQFYIGKTPDEIEGMFTVLVKSGDISLFWHFIFMAITVGVVYPGIRNGIEYWAKWMTSLLLCIVVALFCFNISLDGFSEAASFLLKPDFSALKPSGILTALGLSFFTLSLGQGIMITYGSYMNHKDDIPKMSLIIAAMILLVSLLCAFSIFPIIFTFGREPQAGYGLVFQTLPLLFSKLPGALLLSTIFFMLFVFTALTSSVALVEVVVATCMDLHGWTRKKAALIVGLGIFIFGIPSALSGSDIIFSNWQELYGKTFFKTVDDLVSVWILPLAGLLTAVFIGWKFDKEICKKEFFSETSFGWLFRPWLFFVKWVAPVAIILIIGQQAELFNVDALIFWN